MITIEDNDTPIVAANKIVYGVEEEHGMLGIHKDMFSIEDLEELAEHILTCCKYAKKRGEE